jgi:hypothetical protein
MADEKLTIVAECSLAIFDGMQDCQTIAVRTCNQSSGARESVALERGEQGGIQANPPTLQQSLMARLDRLGPAREVAQISAVIGRDFSYALVRAVVGMDDTALQTMLDRLAEADNLLVQGLPPQSEYRFKHALILDASSKEPAATSASPCR